MASVCVAVHKYMYFVSGSVCVYIYVMTVHCVGMI